MTLMPGSRSLPRPEVLADAGIDRNRPRPANSGLGLIQIKAIASAPPNPDVQKDLGFRR
jgi:hypothetical protein